MYQEQYFYASTLWATQTRVGGGKAKKKWFSKCLCLNSKLEFLNTFPDDESIFRAHSKRIHWTAQGNRKLAEGGGKHTPVSIL